MSLRDQNYLAFRFFYAKQLVKGMKTSFVFACQKIRKQKLNKKFSRVNKSLYRNFQICACAQWTHVESIFFTLTLVFYDFLAIPSVNFS